MLTQTTLPPLNTKCLLLTLSFVYHFIFLIFYKYKHISFSWSKEIVRNHPPHRGADKSLARPISRFILFDVENISFDASLVLYIYI